MSDNTDDGWQVVLTFQDAKSDKFWRARCIDNALEINYGRAGSKGQRQVKRYDSAEDSARELEKQANAKRKKGYQDDPNAAPATAPDTPPAAAPAPGAQHCDLALDLDGRRLELRLSVDGSAVTTVVVERYANDADASAAFQRLQDAMLAEGYRKR